MIIQKCKMIIKLEKHNVFLDKRIILDENNKVIEDAVLDTNKITDINFNNLPSNVFDNIELYLGKEYLIRYMDERINYLKTNYGDNYLFYFRIVGLNIESDFGKELANQLIFNV